MQYQDNMHSRAHCIADSSVPSLVQDQHVHFTNAIIHKPQLPQHSMANTHQICNAIIDETAGK